MKCRWCNEDVEESNHINAARHPWQHRKTSSIYCYIHGSYQATPKTKQDIINEFFNANHTRSTALSSL